MKNNILLVEGSVEFGGSTRCLVGLLKNLNKNKYNLTVLLLHKSDYIEMLSQYCNKIIVLKPRYIIKRNSGLIRLINIFIFRLSHFFSFLRIINKFDLVHLNNGFYYPAILAAKFTGTPFICHFRSLPADCKTGERRIPLTSKFFGKLSDHNLAVSSAVKNEYVRLGFDAGKISIINDGIDLVKLRKAKHSPISCTKNIKDTTIIGTVARLTGVKRIDIIIDSLPYILNKIKNTKFCIVGDGPLKLELQSKVIASGLKDKVIFTGYLKNPYSILASFDVFVLSSDREGLSLCVMEAMALGLPVVATRVGGIVELIEDNKDGILVGPNNPKDIAEAVISIINNHDFKKRISENAIKKGKKTFSIERTIAEVEKKYTEIISRENKH